MVSPARRPQRTPPTLHFRIQHRLDVIPRGYRGWAHLRFNLGLAILGAAALLWFVDDLVLAELLVVPLAFLAANLGEYLGHRYPMHRKVRRLEAMVKGHAGMHHRFFTHAHMEGEDTRDFHVTLFDFLQLGFFLCLLGAPLTVLVALFVSANAGLLFGATALLYFAAYEALHLGYHLPERYGLARIPGFAALRRHHQAHHNPALMGLYNFNITWPLMDLLFGTRWTGPVDATAQDVRAARALLSPPGDTPGGP